MMNEILKTFNILLLILCSMNSFSAQDSILFLSGKTLAGELSYEDEYNVFLTRERSKDKLITKRYSKKDLFSIFQKDKPERIYYKKDHVNGYYFTQKEMRLYITGEQEASNNFKTGYHVLLGFALGFTTSLLDTYEFDQSKCVGYFNNSGSLVSILTPFAVSVVIGFPNNKVRKAYVSDEKYLLSEHYKKGFNQVKQFRKTVYSFIGSFTGVASMLLVTFIHQENHPCP